MFAPIKYTTEVNTPPTILIPTRLRISMNCSTFKQDKIENVELTKLL